MNFGRSSISLYSDCVLSNHKFLKMFPCEATSGIILCYLVPLVLCSLGIELDAIQISRRNEEYYCQIIMKAKKKNFFSISFLWISKIHTLFQYSFKIFLHIKHKWSPHISQYISFVLYTKRSNWKYISNTHTKTSPFPMQHTDAWSFLFQHYLFNRNIFCTTWFWQKVKICIYMR